MPASCAPDPAAQPVAAPVGAIIMAAGAGRRMGNRPKSLLRRDGEPLLLRQARLLRQAGIHDVVVVLGHHAQRIAPVLRQAQAAFADAAAERHALADPAAGVGADTVAAGLRWVTNPAPDDGPGSSLRCGLSALPPDLSAVMVMLGDQPLLEAEDVTAMLTAWRTRGAGIELVVPEHGGQPGHPIVFSLAVRQAVMHGTGHGGVREWRRANANRVASIPMPHARCTTDVDSPQDIERLRERTGVALEWMGLP